MWSSRTSRGPRTWRPTWSGSTGSASSSPPKSACTSRRSTERGSSSTSPTSRGSASTSATSTRSWPSCVSRIKLTFYIFNKKKNLIFQSVRERVSFISSVESGKGINAVQMFRWELERRYRCTECMAIEPFWFWMEHRWTALTPFWLSADGMWMENR